MGSPLIAVRSCAISSWEYIGLSITTSAPAPQVILPQTTIVVQAPTSEELYTTVKSTEPVQPTTEDKTAFDQWISIRKKGALIADIRLLGRAKTEVLNLLEIDSSALETYRVTDIYRPGVNDFDFYIKPGMFVNNDGLLISGYIYLVFDDERLIAIDFSYPSDYDVFCLRELISYYGWDYQKIDNSYYWRFNNNCSFSYTYYIYDELDVIDSNKVLSQCYLYESN